MLNDFIKYLPSRLFVLANVLFWLLMTTLSADNAYRRTLEYMPERNPDWYILWYQYLPYWINFAFLAPVVIAGVRCISARSRSNGQLVLANVLLMLGCMTVYFLLIWTESSLMHNFEWPGWQVLTESWSKLLLSPWHLDFLVYGAVASLALMMSYYDKMCAQAVSNERLKGELHKIELQALKGQLSPHFLFNTLNTISGLVRLEKKNQAVQALSELSLLFRKVLENQSKQLTSLGEEMAFVQSYLTIQKMRFEQKLAVKVEVGADCNDIPIPFMLLHTLVENAVQHGSQLESDANTLDLRISRSQQHLHIRLTNKACQQTGHKGFGIGLKNCRQRLAHLYQGNASLLGQQHANGYFETCLSLPAGGPDV